MGCYIEFVGKPRENVKLGDRLRELRLAAGITGAELADLAGLSQSAISQIETNKKGASLETLIALDNALYPLIYGKPARIGQLMLFRPYYLTPDGVAAPPAFTEFLQWAEDRGLNISKEERDDLGNFVFAPDLLPDRQAYLELLNLHRNLRLRAGDLKKQDE